MREDIWEGEKSRELASLWNQGLTTGEIGRRLGVTKNAVIGKVHRLGLKKRGSPIKPTAADIAARRKAREEAKAAQRDADIAAREARLREEGDRDRLPTGGCRFIAENIDPKARPDGMTWDQMFCRKPVPPGESWCPEHRERVFMRTKAKE